MKALRLFITKAKSEPYGSLWWSVGGSNPRHHGCDPCALPAELTDLIACVSHARLIIAHFASDYVTISEEKTIAVRRQQQEQTVKVRKIYFDLDGVLADFDRGVHELCGMDAFSHEDEPFYRFDEIMWERIKEVGHFYDKLELMEGAGELFRDVYTKYGDKCEILSGIPKPKRGILTAGDDKRKWVRRMLSDTIKVNIVYKEEKPKYCYGADCILIDDLPANIKAWEEIGGTGIINTGAEDTRKTLEEMGLL